MIYAVSDKVRTSEGDKRPNELLLLDYAGEEICADVVFVNAEYAEKILGYEVENIAYATLVIKKMKERGHGTVLLSHKGELLVCTGQTITPIAAVELPENFCIKLAHRLADGEDIFNACRLACSYVGNE